MTGLRRHHSTFVLLRLAAGILRNKRRDFQSDAGMVAGSIQPPLRILGIENRLPAGAPCLFTCNHYASPTFRAWWLSLSISAAVSTPIHWIITEAWVYPDFLRSATITPISRWILNRIARVYGFSTLPPRGPQESEAGKGALHVRRVLKWARDNPVLSFGLAPEGRDSRDGRLQRPPPGTGRFMLHLAASRRMISPVAVYESGPEICVRFGPAFGLEPPDGLSARHKDEYSSRCVMTSIAALLPVHLRGPYLS